MSSGPVEQLYYTWARRGFGVGEGEQMVAASPGLRDVGSPFTQDLMALCRPPVGELSFGWVVRAGHVAIFRRVPAGRDVHGRLGRFFAHVLAAPWGLLTSDDLVDLQSNSLWMEDAPDGVDPNLPTLTLPSLRRRVPVTIDAELHAAVAGALLALESGDPLVLDRDVASSVSLAHRLNTLLAPRSRPERGWLGFSTAEPGSRVPLFNLVGRVDERNDRLQASNALPRRALAAAAAVLADPEVIQVLWQRSTTRSEMARRALAIGAIRSGTAADATALRHLAAESHYLWPAMMANEGIGFLVTRTLRADPSALEALRSMPAEQLGPAMNLIGSATETTTRKRDLLAALTKVQPDLAAELALHWYQHERLDSAEKAQVARTLSLTSRHHDVLSDMLERNPDIAYGMLVDPSLPKSDRAWAARHTGLSNGQLAEYLSRELNVLESVVAEWDAYPAELVHLTLEMVPSGQAFDLLRRIEGRIRPPEEKRAIEEQLWRVVRRLPSPLPTMKYYLQRAGVPRLEFVEDMLSVLAGGVWHAWTTRAPVLQLTEGVGVILWASKAGRDSHLIGPWRSVLGHTSGVVKLDQVPLGQLPPLHQRALAYVALQCNVGQLEAAPYDAWARQVGVSFDVLGIGPKVWLEELAIQVGGNRMTEPRVVRLGLELLGRGSVAHPPPDGVFAAVLRRLSVTDPQQFDRIWRFVGLSALDGRAAKRTIKWVVGVLRS
jgi:hypothetical protein